MEQLIKITSVPMRTMRFSQSARLVSSDSVDMERRKALARQMSFRRTHTSGGSLTMDDITKINRTFSRRNTTPQTQTVSRQQEISKQQALSKQQMSAVKSQPVVTPASASSSPQTPVADTAYEAAAVVSSPDNYRQEFSSSYHAQLGALEMRVAKGDLTFLPPMAMTIVTQRPELHIEYLGEFNYVPPIDSSTGSNINLFT
ncbi:MAG: hypothetical protein HFI92_02720 [Lachnospiraceae bacterium]|nr:hypothetical protein [Lachnospiraceae bacterium]